MALPEVTLIGNLTQDPVLQYTAQGQAVATCRLACSERKRDAANNWVDGDTLYINAVFWGAAGQELTQKLIKGNSVIVTGKLRSREYTSDAGDKRTVYEVIGKNIAQTIKTPAKSDKVTAVTQDAWGTDF